MKRVFLLQTAATNTATGGNLSAPFDWQVLLTKHIYHE
jgi:hypothetical protein